MEFIGALSRDKQWEVVIRPYRRDRSKAQNRIMWKWLTIIGNDLGYGKEEMHEDFKRRFLVPIMIRDDEQFAAMWTAVSDADNEELYQGVVKLLSTTVLNTAQFAEYLTDIERAAYELGIALPTGDDKYYEAMGRT